MTGPINADHAIASERLRVLVLAIEADDPAAVSAALPAFGTESQISFDPNPEGGNEGLVIGDAVAYACAKGKNKALKAILDAGASPLGTCTAFDRLGTLIMEEHPASVLFSCLRDDTETLEILVDSGYPPNGIWHIVKYDVENPRDNSWDRVKSERAQWVLQPLTRPGIGAICSMAPKCLHWLLERGMADPKAIVQAMSPPPREAFKDSWGAESLGTTVPSDALTKADLFSSWESFARHGLGALFCDFQNQRPRSAMPDSSPWKHIPECDIGRTERSFTFEEKARRDGARLVSSGKGPVDDPDKRPDPEALFLTLKKSSAMDYSTVASFCHGTTSAKAKRSKWNERFLDTADILLSSMKELAPQTHNKKLVDLCRWHGFGCRTGDSHDLLLAMGMVMLKNGEEAKTVSRLLTLAERDMARFDERTLLLTFDEWTLAASTAATAPLALKNKRQAPKL